MRQFTPSAMRSRVKVLALKSTLNMSMSVALGLVAASFLLAGCGPRNIDWDRRAPIGETTNGGEPTPPGKTETPSYLVRLDPPFGIDQKIFFSFYRVSDEGWFLQSFVLNSESGKVHDLYSATEVGDFECDKTEPSKSSQCSILEGKLLLDKDAYSFTLEIERACTLNMTLETGSLESQSATRYHLTSRNTNNQSEPNSLDIGWGSQRSDEAGGLLRVIQTFLGQVNIVLPEFDRLGHRLHYPTDYPAVDPKATLSLLTLRQPVIDLKTNKPDTMIISFVCPPSKVSL